MTPTKNYFQAEYQVNEPAPVSVTTYKGGKGGGWDGQDVVSVTFGPLNFYGPVSMMAASMDCLTHLFAETVASLELATEEPA